MIVLNIEDNFDKHMNICMQLKQLNIKDVIWKDNLTDGVEALKDTLYDLIITDMSYPLNKGERPNDDAGNMLIKYVHKQNIETPIILCTSYKMNIESIFGTVNYNPETSWGSELQALIRKLRMRT